MPPPNRAEPARAERAAAVRGPRPGPGPAPGRPEPELLRLQRSAGNQVASRLVARSAAQPAMPVAQREALSFEPEVITGHVTSLGPASTGGTAATRCANLAAMYVQTVNLARDNAVTALEQFQTYMSFPAEAEAAADLVGVATKFALKEGFKALWDWAIKPVAMVPGIGKLADLMITLVEECERAETAAGQVQVRNWLVEQRGQIQTQFDTTLRSMGDLGMNFQRGFATATAGEAPMTGVAESAGGAVAAGDATMVGPGAAYLNQIATAAADGMAHVPTWQAQLQDMIERWVRSQENQVESRGGGDVYMGGRIYLTVRILREDGRYTVTLPTTGRLAAPQADRTGDALRRLLRESGQSVNDLAILKVLRVEVEDEVFGFNEYYHTTVHYRQPGRVEFRSPNFGPRVTTEYLEKANQIVPAAMDRFSIADLQVRSLTSAS